MNRSVGGIAAWVLPVALGLTGCASQEKETKHEATGPILTPQQQQPEREGTVRAWMAYPTGERETSSILVEKIAPAEVRVNEPFDYEVKVTNLTSGALENVVFNDDYPEDFKVTKSTPPVLTNDPMRWAIGTLGAHESKSITVTGMATKPGTIASCGSASFSNSLCLTVGVVQPALKLTKTVTPEATPCDTIVIKYEVKNTGTGAARNVRVTDSLAEGLATSDGKRVIDLDAGTLGAGQSRAFTVNAKASKSGSYTSAARAAATGGMMVDSSQAGTIVSQPVLTIKAEGPAGLLIGQDLTTKFTVKNTGDAPAANTVISAPIPAAATFSTADNTGTIQNSRLVWNLGTLRPGESRTVAMTLKTKAPGTIPTGATVSSTCAAQASDQCVIAVEGVPDIGTSVSDDSGVVTVGDSHTFTIKVTNQGHVNLTGSKVAVELSEGLEYTGTNSTPAPTVDGKNVEFSLGTIKPGETRTFTLVTRGTKAGEQGIKCTTSSNELKRVARNDEQVTIVDR